MSFDQFKRATHSEAPIVTVLAVTAVMTRAVIVPAGVAGQNDSQSPIAHPVVSATFRTVSPDATALVNVVSTVFDAHQNLTQNHFVAIGVVMPHLLLDGDAAVSFVIIVAVYAAGIGSASDQ